MSPPRMWQIGQPGYYVARHPTNGRLVICTGNLVRGPNRGGWWRWRNPGSGVEWNTQSDYERSPELAVEQHLLHVVAGHTLKAIQWSHQHGRVPPELTATHDIRAALQLLRDVIKARTA